MRDPHGRCDMPGLSIIIRWSAQHNKSSQLCCIALHLSTSIPDWRTHRCEEEAKERHYSAWYWRAACRVHEGYAVSLRQHEAEARLLGRHKTRNSVTKLWVRPYAVHFHFQVVTLSWERHVHSAPSIRAPGLQCHPRCGPWSWLSTLSPLERLHSQFITVYYT